MLKNIAAGVANSDVIFKLVNTYCGKLKADTPKNINLKICIYIIKKDVKIHQTSDISQL